MADDWITFEESWGGRKLPLILEYLRRGRQPVSQTYGMEGQLKEERTPILSGPVSKYFREAELPDVDLQAGRSMFEGLTEQEAEDIRNRGALNAMLRATDRAVEPAFEYVGRAGVEPFIRGWRNVGAFLFGPNVISPGEEAEDFPADPMIARVTPEEREVRRGELLSNLMARSEVSEMARQPEEAVGLVEGAAPTQAARGSSRPQRPSPPTFDPSAFKPIDIPGILAKYERTHPERLQEISRDELLLRVLFGLAQGAAMGSRGYLGARTSSAGPIIASAGAGGMGAVVRTKAENREILRQNEEAFQQYQKDVFALERELEQAALEQDLAREKVLYQNRVTQFNESLREWEESRDKVHFFADGYYVEGPDGNVKYHGVPSASRLSSLVSLANASRRSKEEIMLGAQKQWAQDQVPPNLLWLHQTATDILHHGAAIEEVEAIRERLETEDEELQMLKVGASADPAKTQKYQMVLNEKIYLELLRYYSVNKDEAAAILRQGGRDLDIP
jgi:hypothetical protein